MVHRLLWQDKIYAQHERIADAFRRFDENHDGVVTEDEFVRGVSLLNLNLSDDETRLLFQAQDTSGTGVLDYNAFVQRLRIQDTQGKFDYAREVERAHRASVRPSDEAE